MESIHFEKQEAALCAQHAVNMLLQGSYFTAVDLAEIASEVDRREGRVMNDSNTASQNVDDTGFFSLQVIAEALKVFNLELIPLSNPRAVAYRDDPTLGQAYICNLNEHWFAVRRLGFQWFTLNSLLPTPKLISDTYLSLFFAQLISEGVLPPCIADEQLAQCPVDPSLAGMSDSFRDDHSDDPNIARAKAISRAEAGEDEDLRLALELSRQEMKNEIAIRKEAIAKSSSSNITKNPQTPMSDDDEELERQLQKAIQLSLEQNVAEDPSSTSTSTSTSAAAAAAAATTEKTSATVTEKVIELEDSGDGGITLTASGDDGITVAASGDGGITAASSGDNDVMVTAASTSQGNTSETTGTEELRKKRENFLKRFEK